MIYIAMLDWNEFIGFGNIFISGSRRVLECNGVLTFIVLTDGGLAGQVVPNRKSESNNNDDDEDDQWRQKTDTKLTWAFGSDALIT